MNILELVVIAEDARKFNDIFETLTKLSEEWRGEVISVSIRERFNVPESKSKADS